MHRKQQTATRTPWRTTATLLLALFAALLFAPGVVATTSGDDASLPACCRAHGRHHCTMSRAATRAGDGPVLAQVTERCPCPACAPTANHRGIDGVAASSLAYAELLSHPVVHAQVEARRRIALDPAHRKRGPPTDTLLA